MVVVVVEVFKVFSQDRVPQRLPLTFQFLVAIFKVQLPHLLTLLLLRMRLVKGFFALFPVGKKCDSTSALEVGTASALELMDVGSPCLADGPGDRGAEEAGAGGSC